MKFKKGDIVEVIKTDYSGGKTYEVGSIWEVVREYAGNKGKPWDVVYVKDDRKPNKQAALYTNSVKKVEGEKEMKFKIGDKVFGKDVVTKSYYIGRIIEINHNLDDWASYCIDNVYGNKWLINDTITKVEGEKEMKFKIGDKVRCNALHFEMNNHIYSFDNRYNVMEVVEVDGDSINCRVNGGLWWYRAEELNLVTDQPEELMIPVSLVYQVLASEPTNREIKAFLKGYKEGLNKTLTK